MTDWIIQLIESIRYLGIAGLMLLETFLPPLQSEIIMPFSGFTASQSGELNIFGVVAAGTVGSELGAVILYLLVRMLPYETVERLAGRYGGWLGLHKNKLDKWGKTFDEHAVKAVVLGRFAPGLRSFIAIPAALRSMPLKTFALANLAGTVFWVTVLAAAGYILGDNYRLVADYSSYIFYGFIGAIVILLFYRFVTHNH